MLGINLGCPCGLEANYDECCGPAIIGTKSATTAEALMRSRYSAYTRNATTYLLSSWHPRTRPVFLDIAAETTWQGLRVLDVHAGGALHTKGTVTFAAQFCEDGRNFVLHETSNFERVNGKWTYVDAQASTVVERP